MLAEALTFSYYKINWLEIGLTVVILLFVVVGFFSGERGDYECSGFPAQRRVEPFLCSETGDESPTSCCGPASPVR